MRVESAESEPPGARVTSSSLARRQLRTLVQGSFFEIFFTAVVLTNAAFVGWQTQWAARNPGAQPPDAFIWVQVVYAILFTVELLLRLEASRVMFFRDKRDRAWNMFDLTIVVLAVVDVSIVIVSREEDSQGNAASSLRVIRILRITKLVRAFRVVRIVQFVRALRTLVFSIASTMKSLIWSIILLVMIIYVFAIILTQAASDELQGMRKLGDGAVAPCGGEHALQKYWGDLFIAMLTLFESISGGVSWDIAVEPLLDISLWLGSTFILYMSFCILAVLNVFTSVFCQSAIQSAHNDSENIVHNQMMNRRYYEERLRLLFQDFDKDNSGTITLEEFEQHWNDPEVQAYLSGLELRAFDPWTLFRLLDSTGAGSVDLEDFIFGCSRLKGPAHSIDIAKLLADNRWLMKFCAVLSEECQGIHEQLECWGKQPPRDARREEEPRHAEKDEAADPGEFLECLTVDELTWGRDVGMRGWNSCRPP